MKKFVYMIDYENDYGNDQVECTDIKDLITQLNYLIKDKSVIIENVKLVENEERWNEEKISFSLANKIIRILGYKPIYMYAKKKKGR